MVRPRVTPSPTESLTPYTVPHALSPNYTCSEQTGMESRRTVISVYTVSVLNEYENTSYNTVCTLMAMCVTLLYMIGLTVNEFLVSATVVDFRGSNLV